jgi:hypothetical protein
VAFSNSESSNRAINSSGEELSRFSLCRPYPLTITIPVNLHETVQRLVAFALEYHSPVVAFTSACHSGGSIYTRNAGSTSAHGFFGLGYGRPAASFPMASQGGKLTCLGLGVVNMSDVDWLALWVGRAFGLFASTRQFLLLAPKTAAVLGAAALLFAAGPE